MAMHYGYGYGGAYDYYGEGYGGYAAYGYPPRGMYAVRGVRGGRFGGRGGRFPGRGRMGYMQPMEPGAVGESSGLQVGTLIV